MDVESEDLLQKENSDKLSGLLSTDDRDRQHVLPYTQPPLLHDPFCLESSTTR